MPTIRVTHWSGVIPTSCLAPSRICSGDSKAKVRCLDPRVQAGLRELPVDSMGMVGTTPSTVSRPICGQIVDNPVDFSVSPGHRVHLTRGQDWGLDTPERSFFRRVALAERVSTRRVHKHVQRRWSTSPYTSHGRGCAERAGTRSGVSTARPPPLARRVRRGRGLRGEQVSGVSGSRVVLSRFARQSGPRQRLRLK